MTQQAKLEEQVKQLTQELERTLQTAEELLRELLDVQKALEDVGVPGEGSAAERIREWGRKRCHE